MEILDLLKQLEKGKELKADEQATLLHAYDDVFKKLNITSNEGKLNFLQFPLGAYADHQNQDISAEDVMALMKNEKAINLLAKMDFKDRSENMGMLYAISKLDDKTYERLNNLSTDKLNIAAGYLFAELKDVDLNHLEKNKSFQTSLDNFLNRLEKTDVAQIPDGVSATQLGKNIYVNNHFSDPRKNLTGVDLDFLSNPDAVKNYHLDLSNLKYGFVGPSVTYICQVYSREEISGMPDETIYKMLDKKASAEFMVTAKLAEALQMSPDLIEDQKRRAVETMNGLMNYDASKLTPQEAEIFKGKIVDGKVNVLAEIRDYRNHSVKEMDALMNVCAKEFERVAGMPEDKRLKVYQDNNIGKLYGAVGIYSGPYEDTLRYVNFDQLNAKICHDGKVPSSDAMFQDRFPVIMHEMEHAYQSYLRDQYRHDKLDHNSKEYKYARMLVTTDSLILRDAYIDKVYERTAYSEQEYVSDLLGYNFSKIFKNPNVSDEQLKKGDVRGWLEQFVNANKQAALNEYNEGDECRDKLRNAMKGMGSLESWDLIKMGFANIKATSSDDNNSMGAYYFDPSTNKFERKK